MSYQESALFVCTQLCTPIVFHSEKWVHKQMRIPGATWAS